LFDVRINNHSTIKSSLLPKLKIVYFLNEIQKTEIYTEHDPELFHSNFHHALSKFPKQIRIEDREIKSGWIIFKFPKNLIGKRVDYYEIIIEDTLGNNSSVICNLIKEIDYGNNKK